jgi:hypothetical protein
MCCANFRLNVALVVVTKRPQRTLHGAAATQHVNFQAATGELDLGKPASFLGTIAGFGSMDKIDLLSTVATNLAFAGGKLTVENGTATVATLAFSGTYTTSNFALGPDGHGGSLITHT